MASIDKVKQSGRLESTAIAEQLSLDLKQLDQFNAEVKRKASFYGNIAAAYILGAILSGLLLIFGGSLLSFSPPILLFFGFLTIVMIVGAVIFYHITGRFKILELANYRYELAKYVVDVLERDMDKYAMINLSLSFKPTNHAVHTTSHPRKSGWRIDHFADDFLQVSGKFMDGTNFVIKFIELMREKSGRNINGKHRTKPVNKGMHVSIMLMVKSSIYGDLQKFNGAFESRNSNPKMLKIWQGGYIRKLKFKRKSLCLVLSIPEVTPLRFSPTVTISGSRQVGLQTTQLNDVQKIFSSGLLSAYQILNLARLLQKERLSA